MKIRHVVVGVDAGELCDGALAQGMALARENDARFSAVHGVGLWPLSRGVGAAQRWAAHGAEVEARAHKLIHEKLQRDVRDLRFAGTDPDEYLVVRGESPAAAICAHAEEHDADLIVLGEHRRRRPIDLGGTLRGVLARAQVPIWIQPGNPEPIDRILVPLDLSISSEKILTAACTLARQSQAQLEVLFVFVPPDFAYDASLGGGAGPTYVLDEVREDEVRTLEQMVGRVVPDDLALTVTTEEGDPSEKILEHASAADLIVMGSHGHTGLARALLGSTADRVVRGSHSAAVILPQCESLWLETAKQQ